MKHAVASDKSPKLDRIRAFGRMRIPRETERTLFFFLTLSMILLGLLAKVGLW